MVVCYELPLKKRREPSLWGVEETRLTVKTKNGNTVPILNEEGVSTNSDECSCVVIEISTITKCAYCFV